MGKWTRRREPRGPQTDGCRNQGRGKSTEAASLGPAGTTVGMNTLRPSSGARRENRRPRARRRQPMSRPDRQGGGTKKTGEEQTVLRGRMNGPEIKRAPPALGRSRNSSLPQAQRTGKPVRASQCARSSEEPSECVARRGRHMSHSANTTAGEERRGLMRRREILTR